MTKKVTSTLTLSGSFDYHGGKIKKIFLETFSLPWWVKTWVEKWVEEEEKVAGHLLAHVQKPEP